jgi:hypothetical protein
MALLAMLWATGTHWVTLQSVAWLSMFVRYVQVDDVETALKKTFDGQHRCALCRKVEAGRRADREQSPQLQLDRRPDYILNWEVLVPPIPWQPNERSPYANPFFLKEAVGPIEPIPRRT